MQPSLIFTGGRLYTMNAQQPQATALAVSGGHIVAVGDDATVSALAGPHTRRIALGGRTLLPGFNDSHVHLWKVGMLLQQVNARASEAPTLEALVAAFRDRAALTPPGEWIEGRGYDETRLPEGRHPTRADLDRASSEHPIVLGRTCGHILVANSRALELAGIGPYTPDPPGGELDRDANGVPNGVLRETAMALIRSIQPPPSEEALTRALLEAGARCLALGVTSIGEPGVDARLVSLYQTLDQEDRLPLRCDVMAMTTSPSGERCPPPTCWSGQRAKVDTCKLFSDGGLSGGTAALSIPYRGRHDCGLPRFSPEQLGEEIRRVYQAGVSVAVHSIGDYAIDLVLSAFEACARGATTGPRLRIEHFGLPGKEHLRRAQALGVRVATQPSFLYDIGDSILRYLPETLVPQCYPFKAMLEAGLTVGFSSDGPVIADINPLLGLQSAHRRTTRSGRIIEASEQVDVAQSLWCYTAGSAAVAGMDERLGRLQPGFEADLVVLSGDPCAVAPEKLLELKVEQTFVAGRCVYET